MHHQAVESHPRFLRRYEYSPDATSARHYNPAVCALAGKIVMAWRIQNERGLSRIVAATLGKNYQLGKITEIKIDAPEKTHIEDPRLCVIEGELLLFVATVLYGKTFTFIQRGFVLGADFQPLREIPLPYGKNGKGTHEKNWMPFALPSGKLGLVQQIAPEHVVIDTGTGAVHRTPGITKWRWGTMSGRSNAVLLPDGERYLALIGGHQEHAKRCSEYWFGAYTFSAEAPHEILSVSRDPLVWASDRTPALINPFDPLWNPLVVFPAGLVLREDQALISLGLNDSYNALMQFPLEELLANHVKPSELTGTERLLAPPAATPAGDLVRVKNVGKQWLGERGGPYKPGDEWFTSEDRVVALGDSVRVVSSPAPVSQLSSLNSQP